MARLASRGMGDGGGDDTAVSPLTPCRASGSSSSSAPDVAAARAASLPAVSGGV